MGTPPSIAAARHARKPREASERDIADVKPRGAALLAYPK